MGSTLGKEENMNKNMTTKKTDLLDKTHKKEELSST